MAIDASAVASVTGIDVQYLDMRGASVQFLPQQIAVFAQGATAAAYSSDAWQATSGDAAGAKFGTGSPIHHIVRSLLPRVGSIPVWVYPLSDHASGAPSVGDVTPSGTATKAVGYRLRIGGVYSEPFSIPAGAIVVADVIDAMVEAGNAVTLLPVILANNADTDMTATSKWEGASANGILIEVIPDEDVGVAFAITQPVDGANNPDVDTALAKVGNRWITMAINAMESTDTVTLGKFQVWGEARWDQLIRRPLVVFSGDVESTVGTAIAVPDARKTDRINSQLSAPDSVTLPFVVAAEQVAQMAPIANNNPPTDYVGLQATGIVPGADGLQWSWATRDQAVKGGASTSQVVDNVVRIEDVVTFYHPTGENPPPYRHVVDLIKVWNTLYNLELEFTSAGWARAPLIPDDQPTVNPNARKPKSAVAAAAGIVDQLGLQAILVNTKASKKLITANINSQNPKRLDVTVPAFISGNTKIKSVTLNWSFFTGSAAAV
jgi:phage tail sheath gpL-like